MVIALWLDKNPTIGILLCANKNNEMVKLTLPEDNQTILASQYKLYLPTEQQLLEEIKKEMEIGGMKDE
jgi:YhcG PDDEXK nuclease domain